jgi:hypothetical protein
MSLLSIVRSSTNTPAGGPDLPEEDVWEVFRNPRRRAVIQYVASLNEDDVIALGALVDDLSHQEYGRGYASSDRKCMYNSLYQVHLEKLDDIQAVEYDPDRGVVRPGAAAGHLARALDAASEVLDQ